MAQAQAARLHVKAEKEIREAAAGREEVGGTGLLDLLGQSLKSIFVIFGGGDSQRPPPRPIRVRFAACKIESNGRTGACSA